MRARFAALLAAGAAGVVLYAVQPGTRSDERRAAAHKPLETCPPFRPVVDIRASADPAVRRRQREEIKAALARDGTIVQLGPGVDLDFSDLPADFFPLSFGRCVTLTSVAAPGAGGAPRAGAAARRTSRVRAAAAGVVEGTTPQDRSPSSPGPVLRYGPGRGGPLTFLDIRCHPDGAVNDGARISGFRLFGPSFGQQKTNEVGIRIFRCVDVEISNMEIAGWGGSGISVEDEKGPDQTPSTNGPGGRIANPDQVRIHGNFIHHNQHPQHDGHAQGYGINVSQGAWARISRNAFDFNRHSIAAHGLSGGYRAELNLVLKGGGYHGKFYNTYTHAFDVHGTGCWWSGNLCGDAGTRFWYVGNAFQYRKDNAIKIRGKPAINAFIAENVFPHPGLENDWGDDAINLNTSENVTIGPGNVIEFDSFGKLGVCDFDGDRVDDLFLATGRTWWFSSFGEFHWSYLADRTERLGDVRLGYFDDDLRCDVLTVENGKWVISSGGTGPWQALGGFGLPLATVVFGRFDPAVRDHRPGATRRTTHAFRRSRTGQWFVTPVRVQDWRPVASSSFSLDRLRFGDFTGDGVTDVLAVESGRWAISESAVHPWRRLNPHLSDPVAGLFIANMDADDNVDDILRLERKSSGFGARQRTTLTWWRSRNGTEPWQLWKKHVFEFVNSAEVVQPGFPFAGRFGAARGGGTLVIGPNRVGHFHSKAEVAAGASPDWTSVFPY